MKYQIINLFLSIFHDSPQSSLSSMVATYNNIATNDNFPWIELETHIIFSGSGERELYFLKIQYVTAQCEVGLSYGFFLVFWWYVGLAHTEWWETFYILFGI